MSRPSFRSLATAALGSLAALAALGAIACGDDGPGASSASGRLKVVASIVPIGALVQAVGGDLVDVTVLAKAGADPHEYEISPDNRRDVEEAKVIFRNGIGVDTWMDRVADPESSRVVTVTQGLDLRISSEGDDAGEQDPHVWHDPLNDVAMVQAIADALAKADPANADAYRANAAAARGRLEDADRQIRALIDGIPAANRKMVTNHDAFGYFIRRYGLVYVGAVIPSVSTQGEASAKDLAELIDTIRREGVKAIFAESSVDPKVARSIAGEVDIEIVDTLYGDSLGEPGTAEATVEGMLLFNARAIAEALR